MCEQNVPPMSITLASDPEAEFKALTALMKESGPGGENNEEGEGEEDDEEDNEWVEFFNKSKYKAYKRKLNIER